MSVIKNRHLTKYDVHFLLGQVLPTRLVNVYGSLYVKRPYSPNFTLSGLHL